MGGRGEGRPSPLPSGATPPHPGPENALDALRDEVSPRKALQASQDWLLAPATLASLSSGLAGPSSRRPGRTGGRGLELRGRATGRAAGPEAITRGG